MCQALCSELLTESIDKKITRISQQTNISKMYQDLIDEKLILVIYLIILRKPKLII
jgi:hypothetical protein